MDFGLVDFDEHEDNEDVETKLTTDEIGLLKELLTKEPVRHKKISITYILFYFILNSFTT